MGFVLATVALAGLAIAPRWAALGLVFMVVTFDHSTIDFAAPVGAALYNLPPGLRAVLPGTMTPVGLYAIALSIRLALERSPERLSVQRPLPALAYLVPPVIAFGFAWGAISGGQFNFAYHEARGLLVGGAVFMAVRTMRPFEAASLRNLTIVSTTALSVVVLLRYFFVTRNRFYGDLAFAHESVLFLGIGMAVGAVGFFGARTPAKRTLYALFELLLLAAMISTGRRAGTLVLIMTAIMVIILLLPKRPALVTIATVLGGIVFSLYLVAYWNTQSGAIGQPARAIRSQFQPSQRDYNSDLYRRAETYNVVQTIRSSPVLGIGLGRPFTQYQPLWVSRDWLLQFYTPHDNLLWFWLKFGLPGVAVFGGLWAIALGMVSRACRNWRASEVPAYPAVLGASLLAFAQFMQVDVVAQERAMIPFAIVMALALSLPERLIEAGRAPVAVAPVVLDPVRRLAAGRAANPGRPRNRYFPGAI